MGDNRTRYNRVRTYLDKVFEKPEGNKARFLNTLAAMISGIVGSGSCQLPKIAERIPDSAKPASVEKRIKRWIDNENIEWEFFFLPFALLLLQNLGLRELVLAIDGSTVGRGCVTLMVSVIYKKRALPLVCMVKKGKKGHFSEDDHIKVVREVGEIIPEFVEKVVILGDGEFDGVGFQTVLNEQGWLYVCRTGINMNIYVHGEVYSIEIVGSFIIPGMYNHVHDAEFTEKRYGPVTVICWWEKGCETPLYLVTDMESPEDATDYYSKRFRIETFFSDQKSRGFNIHKSHLSDPARLRRLMIGACLAYIWIVFLGNLAIREGWIKIIHRSDRCDLSLFQAGLKLLNYFLDHDITIPVAFHISNLTN